MDMQGKPFKGASSGTKTKADPARYTDPVKEGPGAITSDSLAAESVREGGKFSQNKDSQPMDVEGSHSTFANTNTSAATQLPAAPDAEARLAEAEWGNDRPTAPQSTSSGGNAGSDSHAAPSYVAPVLGKTQAMKPKGKNLTEGGFDNDPAHNASFTSGIASKNDPGRGAELQFEAQNSQNPISAAGAVHGGVGIAGETERKSEQPYGALGSEQEA